MSNEELIDRIRAVNPMPNDDNTVLSSAALLDAVDQASGAMRAGPVEPVVTKPHDGKRRNGLLVAAAALVITLVVVSVAAALTLTEGSDVVDTPTTTMTSTTTTVAPTTTLDPEAAWEAIPAFESDGFGRFRTTSFAVPFSFDTGRIPFHPLYELEDWLSIGNPLGTILAIDVVVVADSIEDTVRAFVTVHDFYPGAQMTDPVPITIGGAQGVMFETTGLPIVLPEGADHPFITPPEFAKTPSRARTQLPRVSSRMVGAGGGEIFVVDVDGQIVVVGYGGVDVGHVGEDTPAIEAARKHARALVDSIMWKDLS